MVVWESMKKSCKYCGRTHPVGFVCDKKPKRFKDRTDESGFRSTWAWTQKSKAIRERDHHLCLACLAEGVLYYGYVEVHHIVPVEESDELKLDDNNLITLCPDHHEQAERGELDRDYLRGLIGHTPLGDRLERSGRCKTTRPPSRMRNP